MSMPFYVAPEQQMKDRADYARKGIARGRSVVVLHYADGILFVAENRSQALHKVSEIYDRIAFAAVGRYNEFENLRQAGIRYADLRGYSYDRTDVTVRGLANAYAQLLGTIFSSGAEKPYEVEIVVAELGATPAQDQIYRLTYDGSVADEANFAVMGGSADAWLRQPRLRYAGLVPMAAQVRPLAYWAWRLWRSPFSIGTGPCPASFGASRVIGLQPCSLMGPRRRAMTAGRSANRSPPRERDHPTHRRSAAPGQQRRDHRCGANRGVDRMRTLSSRLRGTPA
jgi:proteasome alpha subunit